MKSSVTANENRVSESIITNSTLGHRMERFAEVTAEATYRGFNMIGVVDGMDFIVRYYDDLPGVATVISPKSALGLPQGRSLINHLLQLGSRRLLFYDAINDLYREVDVQSLEFKEVENRRSGGVRFSLNYP